MIGLQVALALPNSMALGNPNSGVARLARNSESALQATSGIAKVQCLDPWAQGYPPFDVIHAFGGPAGLVDLITIAGSAAVVVSPIWETDANPRLAGFAARMPIRTKLTWIGELRIRVLRAASQVVAMSNDEADRLERFGVDREKISVVNCCIDHPQELSEAEVEATLAGLGTPDRFALAICNYGAERKNIERLARAADRLAIPLVIGGWASAGPVRDRIEAIAESSGNVWIVDTEEDRTCFALMQAAQVYCQPSLTEGAGLAALEAAARNCNVITTIHGGAVEHLGGLARAVDPLSDEQIEAALREAWETPPDPATRAFVYENRLLPHMGEALRSAYERALVAS